DFLAGFIFQRLEAVLIGTSKWIRVPLPDWLDNWKDPPRFFIRLAMFDKPFPNADCSSLGKPLPLSSITRDKVAGPARSRNQTSEAPACLMMLFRASRTTRK